MLGQPVSMLIPLVVGVKLTGRLREGATATDLVLTVTEMLRKHGVVGKFVEYFGPGLRDLSAGRSRDHREHVARIWSDVRHFPHRQRDSQISAAHRTQRRADRPSRGVRPRAGTLPRRKNCRGRVLRIALARSRDRRAQSRWTEASAGSGRPLAGRRVVPQSLALADQAQIWREDCSSAATSTKTWEQEGGNPAAVGVEDPNVHEHVPARVKDSLKHGSVVIAAITSCTNTSNPSVLIGAGLLAKKAVEKGLTVPAWVKTSLAPGSKVVRDYLENAGLMPYLEKLKFHIVGYGCTTCIGNSGPLPEEVSKAHRRKESCRRVGALSGNRNFEGRINSEVRANYLMSPPLVVAFALAGRIDIDLRKDPLGKGKDGQPVYLADIWPSSREIEESDAARRSRRKCFRRSYAEVFQGDERWRGLSVPKGETYAWEKDSTYIRRAPYFDDMDVKPVADRGDQEGARAGSAWRQRHHRPHLPRRIDQERQPGGKISAGARRQARGLQLLRIAPRQSRSHGARNIRQRSPAQQAGPDRRRIHPPPAHATRRCRFSTLSEKYRADKTPLVILAGKEYGSGSSRDWAAKGPALLGVRAVIAESYERIHRSNLVGMGILPLQFPAGQNAETLKLTGEEVFEITGIRDVVETSSPQARQVKVKARLSGKKTRVRCAGAHRHAAGSAVLRERRNPAVCVCGSCWRRNRNQWEYSSAQNQESPRLKIETWGTQVFEQPGSSALLSFPTRST